MTTATNTEPASANGSTSDLLPELDVAFVQQQFPQYGAYPDQVFCSNAGGSYVARQVLALSEAYDRSMRVQPYSAFSPSREAGEAMDRAYNGWAEALNIAREELTIGPSTSANTYVMAQAIGSRWAPGDEIIVTQQDHETNIGVWRRKAEERGATVREWAIDPETGLLDPADLDGLLNENTRWVFFTHCSNLMGTANPVAELVRRIRRQSPARVGVDAVAYAPHHIADLRALDVDLYVFSLYKVYGPHQGILYVRRELSSELEGQSHYFNRDQNAKRYNPAGPQHSQVAASAGVLDYFEALYRHHGGSPEDPVRLRLERLHGLIHRHESRLAALLLDNLRGRGNVRLLGKADCADDDRAPTIAFQPRGKTAAEVTRALQALGIGTEHGDFYAPRALDHLGIDRDDGVVRLSLLHYNDVADAERIVAALDTVLGRNA